MNYVANTRLSVQTNDSQTRDDLLLRIKDLPITQSSRRSGPTWINWTLKFPNAADEILEQWKKENLISSFAYDNVPFHTVPLSK